MVDLVQGITHMHLKEAKSRNQPKAVEEKVKSRELTLPFIVVTSRSLRVLLSIVCELHYRCNPDAASITCFLTLAVVLALNLVSVSSQDWGGHSQR